jgi:basic membrane lipoprotein Med (substrate-binding protein (PBP1-ABC) superfamily)
MFSQIEERSEVMNKRKFSLVLLVMMFVIPVVLISVNSGVAQDKKITMDFATIGSKTDLSWSQAYFEASEYIKKKFPDVKQESTFCMPSAHG